MMRKVTIAIAAVVGFIATPTLAAAPAPVPSWTGFYLGGEFGVGFSGSHGVNFSPNDPSSTQLFNGTGGGVGEQPLATSLGLSQSGWIGGFDTGYNWQAGSNYLLGLEADFSWSAISGQGNGPSSVFDIIAGQTITQSINAKQSIDWYGTVRGRAGFLATPNLLLFGTGGLAYGRASGSANYLLSLNGLGALSIASAGNGFGFTCLTNVTCFTGSSSAIRTGFTAGGGAEWLLDQHWSAKIEYQFVDLGTETIRVTAIVVPPGNSPTSFNAAFRDQFHVVRVGLNYRY